MATDLGVTTSTMYLVEAIWPTNVDHAFSPHRCSAYTCDEAPGILPGELLISRRLDLFKDVANIYGAPLFPDVEQAVKLASYLMEHGRFAEGWSSIRSDRYQLRGPVIPRVVKVVTTIDRSQAWPERSTRLQVAS